MVNYTTGRQLVQRAHELIDQAADELAKMERARFIDPADHATIATARRDLDIIADRIEQRAGIRPRGYRR